MGRESFHLNDCKLEIEGGVDPELVEESLSQLLRENNLCSMATVTPEGTAHVNTCFCAPTPDLHVIVFTVPTSRHSRNLETNSSVAVTMFDSHQEWGGIVYGCQLFGSGKLTAGVDAAHALRQYAAHHPRMAEWAPTIEELESRFTSRLYRLAMHHFSLLDETRFGKEGYVHGTIVRER